MSGAMPCAGVTLRVQAPAINNNAKTDITRIPASVFFHILLFFPIKLLFVDSKIDRKGNENISYLQIFPQLFRNISQFSAIFPQIAQKNCTLILKKRAIFSLNGKNYSSFCHTDYTDFTDFF